MLCWKKNVTDITSEEVREERNNGVSKIDKIVIATLLVLIAISPLVRKVIYADVPINNQNVDAIVDMCSAGELLHDDVTYRLTSSYELYAVRCVLGEIGSGKIILHGAYVFDRAKEEGIYIKCWDARGNESVEIAVWKNDVYVHPTDGKYYSTYVASTKHQLATSVEQMEQGTLNEWIEKIKSLKGVV